jgi:O-antigen/teichoic acid export membrane protein
MSRSKRFIVGTLAGYGNIAANIVFTVLSVPLALAFLDKEQFGLWALAAQINGYLSLVELGLGNAINRFIADHKDNINSDAYASHMMTGGLVFISQGILIAILGYGISWIAPQLFSIPYELAEDFRIMLVTLSSISGLSVATRSIAAPLWAFQRFDVTNSMFTIGTLMSLVTLWIAFENNFGIFSFPIAQLPAVIGAPFLYYWVSKKNGYYPTLLKKCLPSWDIFKQIFSYGKDAFLLQVGNQLINASQIIMISRIIGLDAAAAFAISTKVYTMGMLLIGNPISSSSPGLTELYVRNDIEKFKKRYWDLISVTIATSTIVAVGIAVSNRSFVKLWTHGSIEWSWICDGLLGFLIISKNLSTCLVNLFGITKNWNPVKYTYLIEGFIFIALSILLTKPYGTVGLLIASLIAHLAVTTPIAYKASINIIGSLFKLNTQIMSIIVILIISITLGKLSDIYVSDVITKLIIQLLIILASIVFTWIRLLNLDLKKQILEYVRL